MGRFCHFVTFVHPSLGLKKMIHYIPISKAIELHWWRGIIYQAILSTGGCSNCTDMSYQDCILTFFRTVISFLVRCSSAY